MRAIRITHRSSLPLLCLLAALLLSLPVAAAAPPSSTPPPPASTSPTTCTLTLAPPTLAITCTGPGPVAFAPIDPATTGITNTSFSGTPLKPHDPTCGNLAAPGIVAAVTLCSAAADLHITNASISEVRLPASRGSTLHAALAVIIIGSSSAPRLHISRLTARGTSGGSALLIRAAAFTGALVTISNSTFANNNNSAGAGTGGALALHLVAPSAANAVTLAAAPSGTSSGCSVVLESNTFVSNTAAAGGGAAVLLPQGAAAAHAAPVSISLQGGNTLQGCRATTGNGGGLLVAGDASSGASVVLGGSGRFFRNQAVRGEGGAMMVSMRGARGSLVSLLGDVQLQGNHGRQGGGVAVDMAGAHGGAVVVAGTVRFVGNNAKSGPGGGLLLNATQAVAVKLSVTHSALFEKNTATDQSEALGGAGVAAMLARCKGCDVALVGQSQFVDNTLAAITYAGTGGGGVHVSLDRSQGCRVLLSDDVRFARNQATLGGGISVTGESARGFRLEVLGQPEFSKNMAEVQGGGMYASTLGFHGALVTMTGASRWVGNTVAFDGGGGCFLLFMSSDTRMNITGPHLFENNSCGSTADRGPQCGSSGGGLHIQVSQFSNLTADVSGAQFLRNQACGAGGGLYLQYYTQSLVDNRTAATVAFALDRLSFDNNTAGSQGGGVLADVVSTNGVVLNISNSNWTRNAALVGGGGLAVLTNQSTVTSVHMDGLQFVENTATGVAGGALLLALGVASQQDGGTRFNVPGQDENTPGRVNDIFVSLSNSHFRGNQVMDGVGGAVFLQGSSIAVQGANPSDTAKFRFATPDADNWQLSMAARNVTLMGNSATYGGGWCVMGSQLRVRGSVIAGNKAGWLGGGVFTKASELRLEGCHMDSNRAGWNGGGIYALLSDDFSSNTVWVNRSMISSNSALSQGGGLYLQAGETYLDATAISSNTAGQQGGGIAYINMCSTATCTLQLRNGTRLQANSALAGGGVFLAFASNHGFDSRQLQSAVNGGLNTAPYAADVSLAPTVTAVQVKHTRFTVPSSTGQNGQVRLVANVGQAKVQVAVKFCDNGVPGAAAVGSAYLVGMSQMSGAHGVARFQLLRLLGGIPHQTYCLQVHTPDYPSVSPAWIWVTIRDCQPGEVRTQGAGCFRCPASQFSFSPTNHNNKTECLICSPYANCTGGNIFVPNRGFWHSAPKSSRVQPCPNRKACLGDRGALHTCQTLGNCSSGYTYHTLQCSAGYGGHLCGSCRKKQGYGQGSYLRCSKCMSPGHSAVLLLALAVGCCCLLVWVAFKSLRENMQQLAAACPTASILLPQPTSGSLPGQSSSALSQQDSCALTTQASKPLYQQDSGTLLLMPTEGLPPQTSDAKGLSLLLYKRTQQRAGASEAKPSSDCRLACAAASSCRGGLELSDVFKVLVVHLQYLSIIGNLLVDWPSALRTLIDVTRMLFVASSSQIVSWDCLGGIGNGTSLVLTIAVPLTIVMLACAVMWLLTSLACSEHPGWAHRITRLLPSGSIVLSQGGPGAQPPSNTGSSSSCSSSVAKDAVVTTALVGLFLFYSMLVSASLTAFSCVSVDRDSYWIKDMEVRCWSRQHLQASLAVGVLGFVVFCVLVPCSTIWWLARNRARVGQPGFHQRYGFLYRLYRPRYCFWEGVVCMQTIALVCVDLFGRRHGTFLQLLLLVMVLVLNYSMVAALRPFRSTELQLLYASSTITLLLTCLGVQAMLRGYLLDTVAGLLESVRNALVIVLLLLNVGFICLCLYLIVKAAAGMARKLMTKASAVLSQQSFRSFTPLLRASGSRKAASSRQSAASIPWRKRRNATARKRTAAAQVHASTQPEQQQENELADLSSIASPFSINNIA